MNFLLFLSCKFLNQEITSFVLLNWLRFVANLTWLLILSRISICWYKPWAELLCQNKSVAKLIQKQFGFSLKDYKQRRCSSHISWLKCYLTLFIYLCCADLLASKVRSIHRVWRMEATLLKKVDKQCEWSVFWSDIASH